MTKHIFRPSWSQEAINGYLVLSFRSRAVSLMRFLCRIPNAAGRAAITSQRRQSPQGEVQQRTQLDQHCLLRMN
jgi:hypothetical protein